MALSTRRLWGNLVYDYGVYGRSESHAQGRQCNLYERYLLGKNRDDDVSKALEMLISFKLVAKVASSLEALRTTSADEQPRQQRQPRQPRLSITITTTLYQTYIIISIHVDNILVQSNAVANQLEPFSLVQTVTTTELAILEH